MTGKRTIISALVLVFTLLLALTLSGCGEAKEAEIQPPAETPAPAEETPKLVQIGSLTVEPDVESISLEDAGATIEDLLGASAELGALREISLGVTDASIEELRAVEAAFPNAELSWKIPLLGAEIDSSAENLDLGAATDGDTEAILSAIARLPNVKSLQLAPEDGVTALSFDSLSALAAAAPDKELNCRFELFGQTADWTTEKLKYTETAVGNEGIDLFRAALPYLRSLTLLRLENCGITDNDAMDALRADFPEINVVWSIDISGYTFMTDTTRINDGDTNLLNDETAEVLRYMHDVLYLDVGHNHHLTNIEFVRNWPKLQVVILTLSNIRDLSPLENCPDLEFLECHSTPIDDLSVLADKDKLEYLNISIMPNLTDLTPLYGLKQLKIVRICGSTFTHIRPADVEALKEALPDTFISDYGGDPNNSGGWRYKKNVDPADYTDRYALLREQMGYDLNWQVRLTTSPSGEED